MSNTHLVISDPHAIPGGDNSRADWIGRLILDTRPDVVVNIGDMFDFPSLSSYEKGTKSFWGRAYKKDLDAGLDFDRRLWQPIRDAKRRHPFKVFCVGNHEHRLQRLLEIQPELEGTVGWEDLQLKKNYDKIVHYTGSTPGTITIDGITYAHYVIAGVAGRALSSLHLGYQLLQKQHRSVTVGHNHTFSYDIQKVGDRTFHGLCCGTLQDEVPDWAGEELFNLWRHGVALKHNVSDGNYDLEWISLARLKQEYGSGDDS